MKATKYNFNDSSREVHFPEGNSTVAVCWNTERITKTLKGNDGLTYRAIVNERKKDAELYIDFVSVRELCMGEFVENEDSPVVGGISIKYAERLSKELLQAIKYIEYLKRENKDRHAK